MTPKEQAAMQQAFEALGKLDFYSDGSIRLYPYEDESEAAIAAMREALAEQVHTPYCKQAPMCKTPCGNSDCVEQAEQEPVGYFAYDEEHDIWEELTGPNAPGATPLYTAPLASQDTHATHVVRTKDPCNPLQDLTDDAIDDIALESGGDLSGNSLVWFSFHDYYKFARAVIAKDREKNK